MGDSISRSALMKEVENAFSQFGLKTVLSNDTIQLYDKFTELVLFAPTVTPDMAQGEWHNLIENPNDIPTKTRWFCCKKKSSDDLVMVFGYEEVTPLKFDGWIEVDCPL